MKKKIEQYEDIIHLDYEKSNGRPHMQSSDRAAQFAPFAALTGHKEKIIESGRYVNHEIELSESELEALNRKYRLLLENADERQVIAVHFFQKDAFKDGGVYVCKTGIFRKIDEYERMLVFEDKERIPIRDIVEIMIP